jgi:hypothetical protein
VFKTVQEVEDFIVGEIERFFPTVHILKSGYPMCGLFLSSPSSWPPGHTWVSYLDSDAQLSATCPYCKEEHLASKKPS